MNIDIQIIDIFFKFFSFFLIFVIFYDPFLSLLIKKISKLIIFIYFWCWSGNTCVLHRRMHEIKQSFHSAHVACTFRDIHI